MARPIEPTPVLEGKDADKLRKEIEDTNNPSEETLKRLKKCFLTYKHFYARSDKKNK